MSKKTTAPVALVSTPAAKYGPCLATFPDGEAYRARHLLDALRLPAEGELVEILTTAFAVAEDELNTANKFERAGEECRAEERRQNVQAYLAAMLEFSCVAQAHAKKAAGGK